MKIFVFLCVIFCSLNAKAAVISNANQAVAVAAVVENKAPCSSAELAKCAKSNNFFASIKCSADPKNDFTLECKKYFDSFAGHPNCYEHILNYTEAKKCIESDTKK